MYKVNVAAASGQPIKAVRGGSVPQQARLSAASSNVVHYDVVITPVEDPNHP